LSQPERISAFVAMAAPLPAFAEIYAEYAKFVWRNLRRLGVPEASIEDAVQDVFLVIHRRLSAFEGRSSLRTWLFGIVLRVAASHRRKGRDEEQRAAPVPSFLLDALSAPSAEGPFELVVQRQATDLLHRVLAELDDEKRTMLIMVELEQTTVAEAAEVLDINLNTAYSRLRAARRALSSRLASHLDTEKAP
jgi:RNA polymerase sigma-70 factor, ECF subfamily